MNDEERFEQLWSNYLEGELDEVGMAELQQLLASNESFQETAVDRFQTHRLIGLHVQDSEERHEDFVRATMTKLPSSNVEFVGDVMRQLPEPAQARKPSRTILFSALAVAAVLLIGGLSFFKNTASPEVARVTGLHGSVQWTGAGGIVQELSKVGHVFRGGTLETLSADAWVDLQFRDGTIVTVSGRSLLTLSEQDQKIVRLRYGNVSADVAPQPAGRPMLVQTPAAELNVLGTQFNVDALPEATRLVVNEGLVRLKRNVDGKEVDVVAQHEITASIEDYNGLVPLQRGEAISVWKSNLKSDVVYGKWIPELTVLAKRLKEAVAASRMTKAKALAAYKKAATLDDPNGTVWSMPSAVGSLIVLSVSQSAATPVVLSPDAELRVRGRMHSQAALKFGMSVYKANGGFAGKSSTKVTQAELFGEDGTFDLVLPIRDFEGISKPGNSLYGHELRECWVESSSGKLQILSMELVQE